MGVIHGTGTSAATRGGAEGALRPQCTLIILWKGPQDTKLYQYIVILYCSSSKIFVNTSRNKIFQHLYNTLRNTTVILIGVENVK